MSYVGLTFTPSKKKRVQPTEQQGRFDALQDGSESDSPETKTKTNGKDSVDAIDAGNYRILRGLSGKVNGIEADGAELVLDSEIDGNLGIDRIPIKLKHLTLKSMAMMSFKLNSLSAVPVKFSAKIHLDGNTAEPFDVILGHHRSIDEIYAPRSTQYFSTSHKSSYIACTATVISVVKDKKYCFLQAEAGTLPKTIRAELFLHLRNLHNFKLDLAVGDKVKACIELSAAQKTDNLSNKRPNVSKAYLMHLKFSREDLPMRLGQIAVAVNDFFGRSKQDEQLAKEAANHFSVDMPAKAIFEAFTNHCPHLTKLNAGSSVWGELVRAVLVILDYALTFVNTSFYKDLVKFLDDQKFFDEGNLLFQYCRSDLVDSDVFVPVARFIKLCISARNVCPELKSKLDHLLTLNSKEVLNPIVQNFLDQNYSDADSIPSFKNVDVPPSLDELKVFVKNEDDLMESLQPVLTEGPYDSTEHYLETYFKLFRHDFFYLLMKAIRSWSRGHVDERFFNVATEGRVVGVHVDGNISAKGFVLSFSLRTSCGVRNNLSLRDRYFMRGNLVAVTASDYSNDVLWASVHACDESKGETLLVLEYIDSKSRSFAESLLSLEQGNGHITVLEVPVLCQAHIPVLRAMQDLSLETFPFPNELAHSWVNPDQTSFLFDSWFDASMLLHPYNRSTYCSPISMKDFLAAPRPLSNCVLDDSQFSAMQTLLRHRLSIVQGPPGTGKTYIGVHLTNLLLNLTRKHNGGVVNSVEGPIVVITYKNHALDEFSKSILGMDVLKPRGAFIRIGGGSKDDEMKQFSLFNFVGKQSDYERDVFVQINHLMANIKKDYTKIAKKLQNSLDFEIVLRHFDNFQLSYLLSDTISQEYLDSNLPHLKSVDNLAEILFDFLDTKKHFNGFELVYDRLLEALDRWLPSDDYTKKVDLELKSNRDHLKENQFQNDTEKNDGNNDTQFEDPVDVDVDVDKLLEERFEAAGMDDFPTVNISSLLMGSEKVSKKRPYRVEPPLCLENMEYITDLLDSSADIEKLRSTPNPWSLSESDRLRFVQAMILKGKELALERLNNLFEQLDVLIQQKNKMKLKRQTAILKKSRVVAMTTSGAAIRADILNSIAPSVVIVEEAAEVNEAQLIALMGAHVKHLVLIGDHLQLRPSVNCYPLVQKFNFDVSMMERLINNGLPFETLAMQNRMHPRISKYLKDIYPSLENNPRVLNIPVVVGLKKPIFFWNHDFPETGGRSFSNVKEAEAVIRLVLYLTTRIGYKIEQITVLAGYQGQVKKLRKLSRTRLAGHLNIQTIDTFQGDENDIIIVSLVRNNSRNNSGFIGVLNRRCVAQSRGRSGVVFLGNSKTLLGSRKGAQVWKPFLDQLRMDGCIGELLSLACKNHGSSVIGAAVGADFPEVFCAIPCDVPMICGKHRCPKTCQPYHKDHSECHAIVSFMHRCNVHEGTRECMQAKPSCQNKCTFLYHQETSSTEVHPCTEVCGAMHSHDFCRTQVTVRCAKDLHDVQVECYARETSVTCWAPVKFRYPFCQVHTGIKLCSVDEREVICLNKCLSLLKPCGHPCPEKCQTQHSHFTSDVYCQFPVEYTCSGCGHTKGRACSEPCQTNCSNLVAILYPCGRHQGHIECSENGANIPCPNKCEQKLYPCGDPCSYICSAPDHQHDNQLCHVTKNFTHRCGKGLKRKCFQREEDIECKEECPEVLDCGHNCTLRCDPYHSHPAPHYQCEITVKDRCPDCEISVERKCFQSMADVLCSNKVSLELTKCGHKVLIQCSQRNALDSIKCEEKCRAKLDKCRHPCREKCGSEHTHESSSRCEEPVDFNHNCGHLLRKKCNENESTIICRSDCSFKLPCNHNCKKPCGISHSHEKYKCEAEIRFNCPICEKNRSRKCCEAPEKSVCDGFIDSYCKKCQRPTKTACGSPKKFQCEQPCETKLSCGHQCSFKCYQECKNTNCKTCDQIKNQKKTKPPKPKKDKLAQTQETVELETNKEQLNEKKKACIEKLREELDSLPNSRLQNIMLTDLDPGDPRFQTMRSVALKHANVKPGHVLTVEKIVSVHNTQGKRMLLQEQQKLENPLAREKLGYFVPEKPKHFCKEGLHGKVENSLVSLPLLSPILDDHRPQPVILVLDVLVGNCKIIDESSKPPNIKALRSLFHSALVRSKQGTDDRRFVFNPNHILVTGYVKFAVKPVESVLESIEGLMTSTKAIKEIKIDPQRELHFDDLKQQMYDIVLTLTSKLRDSEGEDVAIRNIVAHHNDHLRAKFFKKKSQMKSQEIVLFFHQAVENPSHVLQTNFQRQGHSSSEAISFSTTPSIPRTGSAIHLILARVLMAKSTDPQRSIQDSFGPNCGALDILPNSHDILPMFVVSVE